MHFYFPVVQVWLNSCAEVVTSRDEIQGKSEFKPFCFKEDILSFYSFSACFTLLCNSIRSMARWVVNYFLDSYPTWGISSHFLTFTFYFSFFLFLMALEFELRLCTCKAGTLLLEPYLQSLLLWLFFGDRVLWTIFPDWPQITILSISVSQVARIMGMSPQH
jgi:hypothetical protein